MEIQIKSDFEQDYDGLFLKDRGDFVYRRLSRDRFKPAEQFEMMKEKGLNVSAQGFSFDLDADPLDFVEVLTDGGVLAVRLSEARINYPNNWCRLVYRGGEFYRKVRVGFLELLLVINSNGNGYTDREPSYTLIKKQLTQSKVLFDYPIFSMDLAEHQNNLYFYGIDNVPDINYLLPNMISKREIFSNLSMWYERFGE